MSARLASIWYRIKKAYQASGFSKKWLLAYLVLIFVPSSLLLYSYYGRSVSILEEEVIRSMQQTLRQAGSNMEYRLDRYEEISNSLFMNPELHRYLQTGVTDIGEAIDNSDSLSKLVQTTQTNNGVLRVRIYMDDSILYSAERINFFSLKSAKNEHWYNSVLEANGSIVWTGLHLYKYIDRGEDYIVSGARMLRDQERYDQVSGMMVIDVKESILTDILSGIKLSNQQKLYMMDPEGSFVYHPDYSLLGKHPGSNKEILQEISGLQDGIRKVERDQATTYFISTTIRHTGWKLVAEVPAAEISSRVVKLNQSTAFTTMVTFAGLLLVVMFVLLAMLVKAMNRRIMKMIRMIQKEGVEHLDLKSGSARGDFNLLQRNLDDLINKMRQLMEQTYRAQVQERDAQLRALQAQINPHFLYNTLDTINWIAIGRGAHDISHMIDSLAQYFRLSLNKGRDVVSIKDELNLAEVYLAIQQSRFPQSFRYTIESEPDLERFTMPKLTLQPIVENALLHGIHKSKNEESGLIRIRAACEGEILVLTVSDNGIGMEEEFASKLLSEPVENVRDHSGRKGSSYGLYKVNERIKLFAGSGYGLEIQSRTGQGTTVTVRFRAIPG
jgi:two-component system, sensor histidine kinase YesM